MGFSKLHSSLVNSSLWTQPDSTRLLFVTLLAICDRDGVVLGSREGIARIANINKDEVFAAWETLLSPDPDSSDKERAPENEGRRVEALSGGFRILNYAYYRGIRNDEDRREQNREAQERWRNKPRSARVSHGKPRSAHAEAEAEAEVGPHPPTPSRGRRERVVFVPPTPAEVDAYVAEKYPEFVGQVRGDDFVAHYRTGGWVYGKSRTPMKDWHAAVFTWISKRMKEE